MSKSLGNVISPLEVIKNSGADILRLWVVSSDYNEDIRISPVILTRLSEAYRKIRNTARFILSNLYDFNFGEYELKYDNLSRLDKWILFKLQKVLAEVDTAYSDFIFHKAYKRIYDFCNEELSMYYLDMAKGRLYTFAAASKQRRDCQAVLYHVLSVLIRIMAPILTFTAEEIFQNIPKEKNDSAVKNAHLLDWPEINPNYIDPELDAVFEIIPEVAKALEEKRVSGQIGSSFDAKINVLTNNQIRYKYLTSLKGDLPEIFKVSQVEIIKSDKEVLLIEVLKAEGQKCQRCWNYSEYVGKDPAHPLICDRCICAIGGK